MVISSALAHKDIELIVTTYMSHVPQFVHSLLLCFSSALPSGSGAFQMPTRPSSSASAASASAAASASTLRGGKGQSQKRFSNFFSFFCMKLL